MTIFLRARAVFGCAVSKIMLLVKKNTYKYVFIAIVCASRNPTSPSRSSSSVTWWVVSVGRDKSREVPTCVGNVFGTLEPTLTIRNNMYHQKLPKSSQNAFKIDPKNLPKSSPRPSQIEPKWRQEGVRMAKKPKKNIDPRKLRLALVAVAPFWRKKWPKWRQVATPNPAKIH